MQNRAFQIADLISKYVKNACTDSELTVLQNWIKEDPKNKLLFQKLVLRESFVENQSFFENLTVEDGLLTTYKAKANRIYWRKAIRIAAAITLFFAAYLFLDKKEIILAEKSSPTTQQYDKSPAKIGASLTLASGQQVDINDELIVQNQKITSNEELIFLSHQSKMSPIIDYHFLEVKKSNYFKMTLSDGTKVWINAMSSLKFPAEFDANERKVYLTGEAFFDVANEKDRPFIVDVHGKEVQVLGTQFNVNAYGNQFKTTLVEGSVMVRKDNVFEKIKPGQSSIWEDGKFSIKQADYDKELAWKDNEFYFRNDKIATIANDLGRWYDVGVHIDPNVPISKTYSGAIQRNIPLSKVLEMLNFATDLEFKLYKNELIIKNKIMNKS